MCIRDRDKNVHRILTARRDDLLAEIRGTQQLQADLAEAAAVSYTHLRAHETVLDLVCRLLLEKKKQQKANTKSIEHIKN